MNAPQIIYVICAIFSTAMIIFAMSSQNPALKKAKLNIWDNLFGLVFASALYYWGGFFDVFEWPQISYCLIQLGFLVYVANYHGQVVKTNFPRSLFFTAIHLVILYFGGFFK